MSYTKRDTNLNESTMHFCQPCLILFSAFSRLLEEGLVIRGVLVGFHAPWGSNPLQLDHCSHSWITMEYHNDNRIFFERYFFGHFWNFVFKVSRMTALFICVRSEIRDFSRRFVISVDWLEYTRMAVNMKQCFQFNNSRKKEEKKKSSARTLRVSLIFVVES